MKTLTERLRMKGAMDDCLENEAADELELQAITIKTLTTQWNKQQARIEELEDKNRAAAIGAKDLRGRILELEHLENGDRFVSMQARIDELVDHHAKYATEAQARILSLECECREAKEAAAAHLKAVKALKARIAEQKKCLTSVVITGNEDNWGCLERPSQPDSPPINDRIKQFKDGKTEDEKWWQLYNEGRKKWLEFSNIQAANDLIPNMASVQRFYIWLKTGNDEDAWS